MAIYKYDSATDRVESFNNGPANTGTSENLTRVSVSPQDPNRVTIGGITTDRQSAINAGLMSPDAPSAPSQQSKDIEALDKAHLEKEAADKAAKESEADIFRKSDMILDQAEKDMGRDGLAAMTEAAITGDPDAEAAVPAPVYDAFHRVASEVAAQAGLDDPTILEVMLDEEDRQAALRSLIRNDRVGFSRYVSRAIQNADNLANNNEFHAELRDSGIRVIGNAIEIEGQMVPIKTALLRGWIVTDD